MVFIHLGKWVILDIGISCSGTDAYHTATYSAYIFATVSKKSVRSPNKLAFGLNQRQMFGSAQHNLINGDPRICKIELIKIDSWRSHSKFLLTDNLIKFLFQPVNYSYIDNTFKPLKSAIH